MPELRPQPAFCWLNDALFGCDKRAITSIYMRLHAFACIYCIYCCLPVCLAAVQVAFKPDYDVFAYVTRSEIKRK